MRRQQMRNLLATLLLSQGTPMLLAGDEFAHSQGGNNNAYCRDNETTWIDWETAATAPAADQARFVRRLLALRRRYPLLHRSRFFDGEFDENLGFKDLSWLAPDGEEMTPEQWQDPEARALMMRLDGRAPPVACARWPPTSPC